MTITALGINQCLYLPKAELNTKNEPKRPFGFVFGVQLGSLEKKKTRRGPVRAALVHMSISQSASCISEEHVISLKHTRSLNTSRSNIKAKVRIQLKGALYVKDQLSDISFPHNLVESPMLRYYMHVVTVKIFSGDDKNHEQHFVLSFDQT